MKLDKQALSRALFRIILTSKWYTPEAVHSASQMNSVILLSSEELLERIKPHLNAWQRFKLELVKVGGFPLLLLLLYGDMASLAASASLLTDFIGGTYALWFTALSVLKEGFINTNIQGMRIVQRVPLALIYSILVERNMKFIKEKELHPKNILAKTLLI